MKTFFTILLMTLCIAGTLLAQNEYYDSKTIVKKKWAEASSVTGKIEIKVSATNADSVFKLLYTYLSESEKKNIEGKSPEQVLEAYVSAFSENPFIGIGGIVQESGLRLTFLREKEGKDLLTNIGGLDVTHIVNAVADIMIEHAKQELTVAFFDRFKKFVTENPEFRILFPKTTDNLNNLLSYKYPEMLPALRSGFLEDIRKIPFQLDDVLALPRYQELLKDLPEVKIAIRSVRIVYELETGASNAADVINELAAIKEWNDNSRKDIYNAGNIVKTAALFSESLRDTVKDGTVWVPGKELKKAFLDDIFLKIYLGLIYQRAKLQAIGYIKQSGDTLYLYKELGKFKPDIFSFYDKLSEFVILSERVNVAHRDINNKIDTKQTPSSDDYYTYINTSLDVIEYGFSLAGMFHAEVEQGQSYLAILRGSNELYRNIYTKEYNQAMVNAIDLLTQLRDLTAAENLNVKVVDASDVFSGRKHKLEFNSFTIKKEENTFSLVDKDNNKLQTFESPDISVIVNNVRYYVSSTDDGKNPLDKLAAFLEKVKPYALFIANVAEAETEDDIKKALENAILPVGSSLIKKHAVFNISVQSYLGARANMFMESANTDNAWNKAWGVTAPIGVAFSLGGRGNCFKKHPPSTSLFISVFDIGAIVDYKLTTDDKQDYQIKLGQIISPGGYVVWGFPWGVPVSIGIGGQYGPGIFKTDNGIQEVTPGWKLNVFLAVDIPFFNVYNNPRPAKK